MLQSHRPWQPVPASVAVAVIRSSSSSTGAGWQRGRRPALTVWDRFVRSSSSRGGGGLGCRRRRRCSSDNGSRSADSNRSGVSAVVPKRSGWVGRRRWLACRAAARPGRARGQRGGRTVVRLVLSTRAPAQRTAGAAPSQPLVGLGILLLRDRAAVRACDQRRHHRPPATHPPMRVALLLLIPSAACPIPAPDVHDHMSMRVRAPQLSTVLPCAPMAMAHMPMAMPMGHARNLRSPKQP